MVYNATMPQEKVSPNQALEWCQRFLGGAWSTLTVEKIRIDRISGGLSNYLYCCSLPDQIQTQHNEPRKVLLRVYGESHREHRSTLLNDSVVCTLLSERKLGPHVYGIFPDGRLEEFVEAETLLVSEIRDENISRKISGLLGKIHQIDMPLVKEPIWLFNTIERYLSDITFIINKLKDDEDRQIFQELRSVCNFTQEFEHLKKLLSTIDSPVCFTHNDFQPGNILRLNCESDNFTVIDFEYCSYNYRGFDIGNHFCEFMFDYKSATEWPFFKADFTCYPNEKQQMNFLLSYIDALIASQDKYIYSIHQITNGMDYNEIDFDRNKLARKIIKEANYFALAAHFFWTLWAIHMAVSATIKFGYLQYARTRLTAYYLQRNMLTDVNHNELTPMVPQFTEDLLRSSKNPFYKSYIKTVDKII
ncbi:unnamed protein product [Rotaria sp. Silwood2]|nr:unnamed protein product [Rotaria sp. Silwood2]CAF2775464.1 unnamed protein product [Rotaria sp. Silwood2]CAF3328458.1 unnamed protein product [Rotaria sp. Silwood2]CAF3954569.1 unnamed protein product [Rotaria sp. Silwood2]CAF4075318.1 unnamed protein product [Rotaria sp. Silwood2]